jgi:hypothetical protein
MANSTLLYFKHTGRKTNPDLVRAIETGRVRGVFAYRGVWTQRVRIGDFTADADGDQTLDLHTYNPYNLFPEDVWLEPGHSIVPITAFAGGNISAFTAEIGDAGDTDGLVTASSVFTGVTLNSPIVTPSAAQYALRYEGSFIPVARLLSTDDNIADATAGEFEVRIRYFKNLDV